MDISQDSNGFYVVKLDRMYPVGYNRGMIEIRKTDVFAKWLHGLSDIHARARILARIDRMADGNPGDVKFIREGISEMRIHYGAGYRVYFVKRGRELIILLAGGDKSSQPRDIKRAIQLAQNL